LQAIVFERAQVRGHNNFQLFFVNFHLKTLDTYNP